MANNNVPLEVLMVKEYAASFAEYLRETGNGKRKVTKTWLNQLYMALYRPQPHEKIPGMKEIVAEMVDNRWCTVEKLHLVFDMPDPSNEEASGEKPMKMGAPRLAVDQHVTTRVRRGATNNSENTPMGRDSLTCPYCKVGITPTERENHLTSNMHLINCMLYWYRTNRKNLMSDKKGVTIKVGIPGAPKLGAIDLPCKLATAHNNSPDQVIWIVANNSHKPMVLAHVEWIIKPSGIILSLSDEHHVTKGEAVVKIMPENKYSIVAGFIATSTSAKTAVLGFQFRTDDTAEAFHVIREMVFHVTTDTDELKSLLPEKPFQPPPRVTLMQPLQEIIPAPKSKRNSSAAAKYVIPLKNFFPPQKLARMLNHGMTKFKGMKLEEEQYCTQILDTLKTGLNVKNHQLLFSTLLHVEENQMNVDIRQFDMSEVIMKKEKGHYVLEVLGLAENRPSVMRGDSIFIRSRNKADVGMKEYEGRVVEVRDVQLVLDFDKKFSLMYVDRMKFNVRFTFNRHPQRIMQRALEMANKPEVSCLLFPQEPDPLKYPPLAPCADLVPINRDLERNPQQLQAVRSIVSGTSRPAPFLVFGPPGTGKTVTVVESIAQVVRRMPRAHILACAPSNAAADLLAQRVVDATRQNSIIFRMHAPSRLWSQVPEGLKGVSNWKGGDYIFPSKDEMTRYRVVVTTLVTAGRLSSMAFPVGHFTHVFVDEGGQAVEPELLVAVAGILDANGGGQLVVAGDPKQLGPILRSPVVIQHGLERSYLERSMSSVQYQRTETGYDPRVMTKLVQNFRSHPAILQIPNQLFYESELVTCGDPAVTESMCDWDELPRKGFPVIFHCVAGRDMREGASPSFFNAEEATMVADYVQKVMQGRFRGTKVQGKDIGIISPYRQQVKKIRTLLIRRLKDDAKKITVGTTEEYQGQERKVIIISTVRSSPGWLQQDKKHAIGFLANPKRMNVAITRAKSLLVVVGNAEILRLDPNWLEFLRYVQQRGGYQGRPFSSDEGAAGVPPVTSDATEDLLQQFGALELGPSMRELAEAPQWRIDV